MLSGKKITKVVAVGGMVELRAGGKALLFSDGVNLRYHAPGGKRPKKHQLLIQLMDGSAISASIQMYGGLWCYDEGKFENQYYEAAKTKPSPLSKAFDATYFETLITSPEVRKLSLKAFLATEQRIPGLGNGVLQDILWKAGLNPKRKVQTLSNEELSRLFTTIKEILKQMTDQGGRDTETDLFGRSGGYKTVMSKLHLGEPCPACGASIVKEAYLGGSIYYCTSCQKS
jgi:formamidopyrimidine-DNA glycosylase